MKPFAAKAIIIKKYNGAKVAFKDLPLNHKLAIAWYMAVDGEAWEMVKWNRGRKVWSDAIAKRCRSAIKKNIAHFDQKYGHLKFGMVDVPMKEFGEMVLKVAKAGSLDAEHYRSMKSFKEMNDFYLSRETCPIHTELGWPAILNCSDNDDGLLLEDGWHRMNTYYKNGVKMMPLVYYIKGIKYY